MMKKPGVYEINVNNANKEMNMVIIGSWNDADVTDFERDYNRAVKSISGVGTYTLNADCTDMNIITQTMIPGLEYCFNMYKASGFGNFVLSIKRSPIIKMQLNRVLKGVKFPNFEIKEI